VGTGVTLLLFENAVAEVEVVDSWQEEEERMKCRSGSTLVADWPT